jgi:predicted RNase H-like nuclease
LLTRRTDLRERICEVHPEVTFAAWSGSPIVASKKSDDGFTTRHALVSGHFGGGAYEKVRARYKRKDVADDDIVDAFAALWTAERIQRNAAGSLPSQAPVDSAAIPMRIVY